jgi:PEP-CTERM motif
MRICNLKALGLTFGAGLAIAASTISASASTVLTDTTFTDVTAVSGFTTDPSGLTTVSASVCSTCGKSGGPGLRTIYNATASTAVGNFAADAAYVDNSLVYDPATEGAISSITFHTQRKITVSGGPMGTVTTHVDPMVYQDGNYYMDRLPVSMFTFPGTTGFVNVTKMGLIASDFVLFDLATDSFLSGNPNFTSTGDSITFGILPFSDDVYAGQIQTHITDDLSFTISQTPVPATLPLFATGLGALGLFGWRRKRKNTSALAAA